MAKTTRYRLREVVKKYLSEREGQRFTAREIAEWIFFNHREACEVKRRSSKQDLSDDAALVQQVVAEIGANRPDIQKQHPELRTTQTRPRRYYWTSATEEQEAQQTSLTDQGTSLRSRATEAELYPRICGYLHTELGLYPLRVDDKKGSNRQGQNGNKWLYPDLVALEDLGQEWNQEVRDCVKQVGGQRARLWSFEVKLVINRVNVREVWFQTVSNSSWANLGYLVAAEVQESAMAELRLLASSYGIGLIALNPDDPSESEILIAARERPDIDWDACNRLASESPDFRDFVSWVRQFHQTNNVRVGTWDIPAN
ncbi:MAG: HrgA protein [Planctomycetes bacterium]|nr:HrgA protein [Planctomycetota bacterium]